MIFFLEFCDSVKLAKITCTKIKLQKLFITGNPQKRGDEMQQNLREAKPPK